jgi:hypothetical protein
MTRIYHSVILNANWNYKPNDVAYAARGSHWGWSGSAVIFWQSWVDEFKTLLNSADARIQEIGKVGKELFKYELEKAQKDENKEAIYGISYEE